MKQEQLLDKIDFAISELEKGLASGKSEVLKTYLQFLGRFHRYSFGNQILIFLQCPNATFIAGYGKWPKIGRFVKKGEKAIRILAPLIKKHKDEKSGEEKAIVFGYKTASVFDVSQTDGQELPGLGCYEGEIEEQLKTLEAFTLSKEIKLHWESPGGGAYGASYGGVILVDPSQKPAEKFATLIHELAHELLHTEDRRKETGKSLKETEAEAVAFAVCSALGMETNGFAANYIHLHQGDTEKLKASLDLIRGAASEILSALQSHEILAVSS